MSSASSYPPPPRRQPDSSTLYESSPHTTKDQLLRRRNHSSHTDPFHVVIVILLLGLFLTWQPRFIPFSSSLGLSSPSTRNRCSCTSPDSPTSMVWQKTFTLPSASKGCHLVTNVVEKEISEGLKGCKVRRSRLAGEWQ